MQIKVDSGGQEEVKQEEDSEHSETEKKGNHRRNRSGGMPMLNLSASIDSSNLPMKKNTTPLAIKKSQSLRHSQNLKLRHSVTKNLTNDSNAYSSPVARKTLGQHNAQILSNARMKGEMKRKSIGTFGQTSTGRTFGRTSSTEQSNLRRSANLATAPNLRTANRGVRKPSVSSFRSGLLSSNNGDNDVVSAQTKAMFKNRIDYEA